MGCQQHFYPRARGVNHVMKTCFASVIALFCASSNPGPFFCSTLRVSWYSSSHSSYLSSWTSGDVRCSYATEGKGWLEGW